MSEVILRDSSPDVVVIPSGPPGATGIPGANVMAIGLFTVASGLSIPTGTDIVRTAGYSANGLGIADYVADAAVDAAYVTANPRTSFISSNGRGFKLAPKSEYAAEVFGAVADYTGNPATATDNYDALMAALQFFPDPTTNWSPKVQLGQGNYYTSETLEPRAVCHLVGMNPGKINSGAFGKAVASVIVAPFDKTILLFNSKTGVGATGQDVSEPQPRSAAESRVESLSVRHTPGNPTPGVTNLNAHGIHSRTVTHLKNIVYENISGNAEHRVAYTSGGPFGNASGWTSTDNHVQHCHGVGSYTEGADVNTGRCTGFQVNYSGGLAIYDNAFYVNEYSDIQIEATAFGGVQHNGRKYQLLHPTSGSTTTPGTNASIWYDVGPLAAPDANYPAWVNGNTYKMMGAGVFLNPSTKIDNYYIEGNGIYGFAHAAGTVVGTNMGWTHLTNVVGQHSTTAMTGLRGVGQFRSTGSFGANHIAYAKIGAAEQTIVGGIDSFYGTFDIANRRALLRHSVADEGILLWRWNSTQTELTLGFNNRVNYLAFTGLNTTATFGSGVAKPDRLILYDHGVRDPADANRVRLRGIRAAAPTTGTWAQGDIMFNAAPTAGGAISWNCVTAGTPGTWLATGIAGGVQAAAQADSTASDVAGLVADFNALLAKLRTAGLIAT